jgi:oxalate decarboxylase
VLIVFNTSAEEPKDDIGLVASLNALPRDVLATIFGVTPDLFDSIPPTIKPVTIARKSK